LLEELIKVLMFSAVIVFFVLMCYESLGSALNNHYYTYANSINELRTVKISSELTDGFKVTYGVGNFIVCKPILVNNHPGRVCFAS